MATTYAMGIVRDVQRGPDIVRYLEELDATLAPWS
jgi:hypothetical protein